MVRQRIRTQSRKHGLLHRRNSADLRRWPVRGQYWCSTDLWCAGSIPLRAIERARSENGVRCAAGKRVETLQSSYEGRFENCRVTYVGSFFSDSIRASAASTPNIRKRHSMVSLTVRVAGGFSKNARIVASNAAKMIRIAVSTEETEKRPCSTPRAIARLPRSINTRDISGIPFVA